MPQFKQLQISDEEFKRLAGLIYEHAGIRLQENKKQLIRSRLRKRLNRLNLNDFSSYLERIKQDQSGEELFHLLQAISTNVTSFFREPRHFDFLSSRVVPELQERFGNDRTHSYIHCWSAGCSTGEEPYTLAISMMENMDHLRRYRFKILATDLSREALRTASRGVYEFDKVSDLNPVLRKKYFNNFRDNGIRKVQVRDRVKQWIRFGLLNLKRDTFPFDKQFDLIICRNVMIYFDDRVVQKLIRQYTTHLKPEGYLFIGHSESLTGLDHDLEYVEPTIYRKP